MSDISPAVPREGYPARRVDANDPPFRVWIVDPLPTSREGLRRIIDGQSQLRVAGTSSDASDLIATSDTPSLDVVLITDKVPVNKAFITIQKIRQTKPEQTKDNAVNFFVLEIQHDAHLYLDDRQKLMKLAISQR